MRNDNCEQTQEPHTFTGSPFAPSQQSPLDFRPPGRSLTILDRRARDLYLVRKRKGKFACRLLRLFTIYKRTRDLHFRFCQEVDRGPSFSPSRRCWRQLRPTSSSRSRTRFVEEGDHRNKLLCSFGENLACVAGIPSPPS